MGRIHHLVRTQFVPRPLEEVFDFFTDAFNLERITPPFLGFQVITPPPIEIRQGTLIDYRLKLHGLPLRWKTRIERFERNVCFVDLQLKGPYRLWHHLHEFRAVPGGTELADVLDYQLPFGPLGDVAHALFVRRSVEQIFEHRQKVIAELFG